MPKLPLALLSLILVFGGCDTSEGEHSDAAGGVDGGAGSQGGSHGDAGAGGTRGSLDTSGDTSREPPAAGCYPSCIEALRQKCQIAAGETCVQDMTSMVGGARVQYCYSGGIRESLYDEVLPEGPYSTRKRTLADGVTTCFLQSQATMGTAPFAIVRDASGKRVATIQPTAELGKPIATCIETGEAKMIDPTNPACAMSRGISCQVGVCKR